MKKYSGYIKRSVGCLAMSETGTIGWKKSVGKLLREVGMEKLAIEILKDAIQLTKQAESETPNLFAIVPIQVLERTDISQSSKLLYAEITALSRKNRGCWATNEYISGKLGLSKRTIPRILKELLSKNLIKLNIKRSRFGTRREIHTQHRF